MRLNVSKMFQEPRQKWVTAKDLLLVNIVLKKFKEKDNYFNPMRYLGGDEQKILQNFTAVGDRL